MAEGLVHLTTNGTIQLSRWPRLLDLLRFMGTRLHLKGIKNGKKQLATPQPPRPQSLVGADWSAPLAPLYFQSHDMKEHAATLLSLAQGSNDPKVWKADLASAAKNYDDRMSQLATHMPTIHLFNDALHQPTMLP